MSGNGHSPFVVRECVPFPDHRAALEVEWPGLNEVFEAVKQQFRVNPMYNARRLGTTEGLTWEYKTRAGHERPPLTIYYEIDGHEVRLRAAYAKGHETHIV
jgi:hypothetical protein